MKSLGDVLKQAEMAQRGNSVMAPPTETASCKICGGAGYLRYDVPLDDARFGDLVACECTVRDLAQRRMRRLVERSNLGALTGLTFDSFHRKIQQGTLPRHSPDNARQIALAFAEGRSPFPWLLFWGAFGTGKTHLAVAIANYRLAHAEPAIFIVVPDLLDHLRSAYSPNSEVTYDDLFESIRETPLLILDDLGAHTSTPWAQEKLYQVINHRYNKRLETVVTTNLSPDEIEPRLRSRLGDGVISQMVEIRDVDKRIGETPRSPNQTQAMPRRNPRRLREDDRV